MNKGKYGLERKNRKKELFRSVVAGLNRYQTNLKDIINIIKCIY